VRLLRERESGADGKNEFPPAGDELRVKIKAAAERGADAPPAAVYHAGARYPDAQRKARRRPEGVERAQDESILETKFCFPKKNPAATRTSRSERIEKRTTNRQKAGASKERRNLGSLTEKISS